MVEGIIIAVALFAISLAMAAYIISDHSKRKNQSNQEEVLKIYLERINQISKNFQAFESREQVIRRHADRYINSLTKESLNALKELGYLRTSFTQMLADVKKHALRANYSAADQYLYLLENGGKPESEASEDDLLLRQSSKIANWAQEFEKYLQMIGQDIAEASSTWMNLGVKDANTGQELIQQELQKIGIHLAA